MPLDTVWLYDKATNIHAVNKRKWGSKTTLIVIHTCNKCGGKVPNHENEINNE